jgi:hypothetical protein
MINEKWAILSIFGVWGWILSAVGFIIRAFPSKDRFTSKSALFWGCWFIFFYAIWIIGMIKA